MSNQQSAAVGVTWTDRGDPASWDYVIGDFIKDGSWYDLDISSKVGAGRKLVNVRMQLKHETAGALFLLRKKGNSDIINCAGSITVLSNVEIHDSDWVETDSSGVIQYKAFLGNWTIINLGIRGWWNL